MQKCGDIKERRDACEYACVAVKHIYKAMQTEQRPVKKKVIHRLINIRTSAKKSGDMLLAGYTNEIITLVAENWPDYQAPALNA